MPRVRILSNTGETDDVFGFRRLPAGTVLEVDDDKAKRWTRDRIAEATDAPLGVVSDAEAHASVADLDAQIARLQELKAARSQPAAAGRTGERTVMTEGTPPASFPPSDEHPLAGFDLNERQRTALMRAGFTTPQRIADATDDELLEVEGVGDGVLKRLRT